MSGLVDGRTAAWDFVASQLHRDDLKTATSGIVAASKPTPRPPVPSPDALARAAASLRVAHETTVLEQTRTIARAGMAARALGHAIADNLRRLATQEEPHP